MKIESVSQKYLSAAFKAISVIVFVVSAIQVFSTYQFKKQHERLKLRELNSSIVTLRKDLSGKVSIIASSQIFMDYLRSGKLSRQKLELDLQILVASLKDESITGILIEDNNSNKIFSFGFLGSHQTKLNLCYLNNSLNTEYGRCIGYLHLGISPEILIEKLMDMNPSIKVCSSCKPIFFDNEKSFGSLSQVPGRLIPLKVEAVQTEEVLSPVVLEFGFLLLVALIFYILHRTFKTVSTDYIYKPIKDLTFAIEKGELSNLEQINIHEIRYLAECLNKYLLGIKEQEELKSKASLGEIVRQVAHDIRSPLAVIEILINDNDVFHKKDKEILNLSLGRISSISNDLLEKSRGLMPILELEALYLFPLIAEIVQEESIRHKHNPNIEIKLNYEDENIVVKIREMDLKRVISNLINNSVDSIRKDSGLILISIRRLETNVEISIKDNGIGIPQEILNKLFESPLSYRKPNGNGIGLTSAKKTIESFSGSIGIESSENIGTVVKVYLPFHTSQDLERANT